MTTQTPKLLTEADIDRFGTMSRDAVTAELRARGMIAEEPVDPLLVEAREICAAWAEGNAMQPEAAADNYRSGAWDDAPHMKVALAALRRVMELQREKLTVEVVDEALVSTFGDIWQAQAENVHAALTEALQ